MICPPRGDLQFRGLAEEHLTFFGDALQASVEPEHRPYVVDNQHGYLDYLRLVIDFPVSFPHHRLRVLADAHGRPAAFADFRVHPPARGFLSSLVVFPPFRGRGLGKRILRAFADEFPAVTELGLDVFADNSPAIGLYTAIGFHRVASHHWLVREVRPGPHPVALTDLPQGLGMHAAHGFASFTAEHRGSHTRVGLIGDHVINCFEEATFTDHALLSAIARTFTSRRTSAGGMTAFHSTTNRDLSGSPRVAHVNTSERMVLTDMSRLRGSAARPGQTQR
ncbi:GNAT family N-acetyltransferase [Brevibacterium jeotgali]|uniref:Acetyltransferase (GNAT) family protein n=1 Tax=Brevibacterium jeotgali TaxID=1262550 RepID=A0A2H1L4C4_9MICO|nr:GNAT family N-acetyltransferase [Brevibacterium jeotgali]TWB98645.1 acetyltransferase (GNAT) family protein [Brevibacterium jeotgali]SMY11754.1 Acetyltransferase (GNAT) family protein [Brevibacterium jeotgali]